MKSLPEWVPATLVGVALLSVGCGESVDHPETASVTGTVTLDGTPVEGAQITLKPSSPEGQSARATSAADGTFEVYTFFSASHDVPGAVPGTYQVSVMKSEPASTTPDSHGATSMPTTRSQAQQAVQQAERYPGGENALPQKYSDPTSSGLEITVSAGQENTLPLQLTSQ